MVIMVSVGLRNSSNGTGSRYCDPSVMSQPVSVSRRRACLKPAGRGESLVRMFTRRSTPVLAVAPRFVHKLAELGSHCGRM
jgi:hypothetical protein